MGKPLVAGWLVRPWRGGLGQWLIIVGAPVSAVGIGLRASAMPSCAARLVVHAAPTAVNAAGSGFSRNCSATFEMNSPGPWCCK